MAGIELNTYSESDWRALKLVERAVIDTIRPLKGQTHPGLVFFALLRVARVFFRKMPKHQQKEIGPVVYAYIVGKSQLPEWAGGDARLITPGDPGFGVD